MFRIFIISLLVLGLGGCSKEKPKETATSTTSETKTTTKAPAAAPDKKPEDEEAPPPPPPPGDGKPKNEQGEEVEESTPPPAPPKTRVAENTSLIDEAKNATTAIPATPVLPPKAVTRVVSAPPPVVAKAPPVKAAVPAPAKTAVPVAKVQPIPVQPAPQPQPQPQPKAATPMSVDNFSNKKLEELNGLAKPLVEEIETKVEADPTGTGTINAEPYQRKVIDIDGVAYQIDTSKNFFQVRQGDPRVDDETFYFLDVNNDGVLDRVLRLKEKIDGPDAGAQIRAMEMNLYQPFSAVFKDVEFKKSLGQTNYPDYDIFWLGDPNMAASIDFKTLTAIPAKTDNEAHLNVKRKWMQALSRINSDLKSIAVAQPTPVVPALPVGPVSPMLSSDDLNFVNVQWNEEAAKNLNMSVKSKVKAPAGTEKIGELLENQTVQNPISMVRFEMEVVQKETYKVPDKKTFEIILQAEIDRRRNDIIASTIDPAARGKKMQKVHDDIDALRKKIFALRSALGASTKTLKKNQTYDYIVGNRDQFGLDVLGTPFLGKLVYYGISQKHPGDEFEFVIPLSVAYHTEHFAKDTPAFQSFGSEWHSSDDEKWEKTKIYTTIHDHSENLRKTSIELRDLLLKEFPTIYAPPHLPRPEQRVTTPRYPAPWLVIKIKILPLEQTPATAGIESASAR